MKIESGKVYNVIALKETGNITSDKMSIVFACLLVEYQNGVHIRFLNYPDGGTLSVGLFEFMNNWKVISEYKFEDPYEYTSTTTH